MDFNKTKHKSLQNGQLHLFMRLSLFKHVTILYYNLYFSKQIFSFLRCLLSMHMHSIFIFILSIDRLHCYLNIQSCKCSLLTAFIFFQTRRQRPLFCCLERLCLSTLVLYLNAINSQQTRIW